MDDAKLNRIIYRALIIVFPFATVWAVAGFRVVVMLAEAEDPPGGPTDDVPWLLKAAYAILVSPSEKTLPWEWLRTHLGERLAIKIELASQFMAGVFWASLSVFLYCLVKRFIKKQTLRERA
jgi:hypothetical protein